MRLHLFSGVSFRLQYLFGLETNGFPDKKSLHKMTWTIILDTSWARFNLPVAAMQLVSEKWQKDAKSCGK
jgi:hypothetical protein